MKKKRNRIFVRISPKSAVC